MIFYKITQSKNSLSKEGETLYFAKTTITGKTDFNDLCDKVNKMSKIDKSVAFLAECEKWCLVNAFSTERYIPTEWGFWLKSGGESQLHSDYFFRNEKSLGTRHTAQKS